MRNFLLISGVVNICVLCCTDSSFTRKDNLFDFIECYFRCDARTTKETSNRIDLHTFQFRIKRYKMCLSQISR